MKKDFIQREYAMHNVKGVSIIQYFECTLKCVNSLKWLYFKSNLKLQLKFYYAILNY